MDRNLDGVYFRIKRNDEWQNVCFSDLTREEKESVCKKRSAKWCKSLAIVMAETLKDLGDQLDIMAGSLEEGEGELN